MIMEEIRAAHILFLEKQADIAELLLYPPFAFMPKDKFGGPDDYNFPAKTELGRKLEKAFDKEINRVNYKSNMDPSVELFSDPFSKIEKEFETDLEEARQFRSRYPDREEALIESEKLKPVNEEVVIVD
jgi:hypothetical protein